MRPKGDNVRADSELAAEITKRINLCEKPQAEIARNIGYQKPNMLTMIKQGLSKLPFEKAPKLASELNWQEDDLLERMLKEYEPHIYTMIKDVYKTPLAEDELALVMAFRDFKKAKQVERYDLTKARKAALVKTLTDNL